MYYIPSFITPTQESDLLTEINKKPWVQLSKRRLQVYPAQLTKNNVLISKDPLPSWLEALRTDLDAYGVFDLLDGAGKVEMNHVLINNYKRGEGIMPHEDGAAYFPITATISLSSHTVLDVTDKTNPERRWRVLQEPRSLLVTCGAVYSGTLHGIAEAEGDGQLHGGEGGLCNWESLGDEGMFEGGWRERGERVSLTCRGVRRVSKLPRMLLGR